MVGFSVDRCLNPSNLIYNASTDVPNRPINQFYRCNDVSDTTNAGSERFSRHLSSIFDTEMMQFPPQKPITHGIILKSFLEQSATSISLPPRDSEASNYPYLYFLGM